MERSARTDSDFFQNHIKLKKKLKSQNSRSGLEKNQSSNVKFQIKLKAQNPNFFLSFEFWIWFEIWVLDFEIKA